MTRRTSEIPHLSIVDLSILFVTHNRSDLLAMAYASVRDGLDLGDLSVEYVIADDGSSPNHVAAMHALGADCYAMSRTVTGLGANCNRGLAATRGQFILQVQDDFEFIGTAGLILAGLRIMKGDASIGLLQLTNPTPTVPHEIRCLDDGTQYWVFENDQQPAMRACGERPYSDQPHLKRKSFVHDIGPYAEGVPMTHMELEYQRRTANQRRWRVARMLDESTFQHRGSERSFNPCVRRAARLAVIEESRVIGPLFRHARPYLRGARAICLALFGRGLGGRRV